MKKILSLVLALVMTISCASFAFAAPAIDEDAADVSIYADAIDFLNAIGLYNGDMTETDATNDVLRWHMTLFVARMTTGILEDKDWKGSPEDYTEFSDITGVVYDDYRGAISYANQMGIIKGFEDGTFRPYDGIEYQQAVTMLCRALGYTKVEGDYPWGFLQKAANIGLNAVIKTDKTVAPTTKLNRAQTAQLIFNALFIETAKGDKLIDRVFDGEYVFANVMVSASEKLAGYVAGVEKTAKDSGKVALTTVDAKGEFGTTYTVAAAEDLVVGDFFEVILSVNGETKVLLKKALETNTITDNGINDNGNIAAAIKANKFVLKTFGTNVTYQGVIDGETYGIDWTNGNIVKKVGDVWETVWYYNARYDTYFKVIDKDVAVDEVVINGIAVGIKYMTADEAEELKAIFAGKEFIGNKADGKGLATVEKIDVTSPFGKLEVTNVAGKDIAVYTDYAFGQIAQIKDGKITVNANGQASDLEVFSVPAVANKAFVNVGLEAKEKDYVIYDYNEATTEFEVIEIVDEVVYGNLTGIDFANNRIALTDPTTGKVTTLKLDYAGLTGTAFAGSSKEVKEIFSEYFLENYYQYVKVVVLDGVAVAIEVQDDANYIIVDKYAGFSSDNYITVWGYNTANNVYELIRINSYDGWKQGDYFYYLDSEKVAESFHKGVIYEIASVQPDGSYNVNVFADAFGDLDEDALDTLNVKAQDTSKDIYTDEGYISVNGESKKNTFFATGKPIIFVGGQNGAQEYSPITIFDRAITDPTWKLVNALYIKEIESAYVVVGYEDITGFNLDQTGVSFGIYTGIITGMDRDDSFGVNNWYLLGATEYTVKVFDLFEGSAVDAKVNYNLGTLVKGAVYTILDGRITENVLEKTGTTMTATVIEKMAGLYEDDDAHHDNASAVKMFFEDELTAANYETIATLKTYLSKNFVSDAKDYQGKYDGFVDSVSMVRIAEDANGLLTATVVGKKDDNKKFDTTFTPAEGKKNTPVVVVYDVASESAIVYILEALAEDAPDNTVTSTLDALKVKEVVVWNSLNVGTGAANDDVVIKAELTWVRDTAGTETLADDIWTVLSVRYFFDDLDETDDWVDAANTNGGASLQQLINAGFHFGTEEDFVDNLIVIDGAVYNHSQDLVVIEKYNNSNYIRGLTVVYNALSEDGIEVVVTDEARVYDKAERDASATTPVTFSIAYGEVDVNGQLVTNAEFGFIADATLNIKNASVDTTGTGNFINK